MMTMCQVASSAVCSICLEEINSGDKAVCIPCGHEFHYTCASKWTSQHNDCSYCRQKVLNVRFNICSDYLFDEEKVSDPEESLTLQFGYTAIGNGVFLHSLQPLAVYEIFNSTSRTVQLLSQVRGSNDPIAPRSHFQLQRSHLQEIANMTVETLTSSLSLATALTRLRAGGRDVFTEHQSLPWSYLLNRVDGTSRLVHSTSRMQEPEQSESPPEPYDMDCESDRMRRQERRRR